MEKDHPIIYKCAYIPAECGNDRVRYSQFQRCIAFDLGIRGWDPQTMGKTSIKFSCGERDIIFKLYIYPERLPWDEEIKSPPDEDLHIHAPDCAFIVFAIERPESMHKVSLNLERWVNKIKVCGELDTLDGIPLAILYTAPGRMYTEMMSDFETKPNIKCFRQVYSDDLSPLQPFQWVHRKLSGDSFAVLRKTKIPRTRFSLITSSYIWCKCGQEIRSGKSADKREQAVVCRDVGSLLQELRKNGEVTYDPPALTQIAGKLRTLVDETIDKLRGYFADEIVQVLQSGEFADKKIRATWRDNLMHIHTE